MKFSINHCIPKYDGPARAVISVTVNELAEGEKFEPKAFEEIAKEVYDGEKPLLEHAYFFGHQHFRTIVEFYYEGSKISVTLFPCVTDNF